jgi:sugar (pentulose or hexulose) kinase
MSAGTGSAPAIAALDIGKTHSRLLLVDAASGELAWSSSCDSSSRTDGVLSQLDVAHLERWLLAALADAASRARVTAMVPVAHGAAAVLTDAAGGIVAAPDYEDTAFDDVADSYRALRDDYGITRSPFLPLGLNLGRQWHWLQQWQPGRAASVKQALLYPQYWAWRLSGVAASEVTSLGSHTDLWRPVERCVSPLAVSQGWSTWLPPLRGAHEVLGPITANIAARTGLPTDCRVLCGIHDSNASYLCHLAARATDEPFAVISSGTWTVIMARGISLERLREQDDMLANVDARGAPVATARFMGGREFAAIAGDEGRGTSPSWPVFERVIADGILALPSFAPAGGPFAGRTGRIVAPRTLTAAESAALATLYMVLLCDRQLDALGVRGTVVVDGPLSLNPAFAPLLALLRSSTTVEIAGANAGAAQAARILCGLAAAIPGQSVAAAPIAMQLLRGYRELWHRHTDAAK